MTKQINSWFQNKNNSRFVSLDNLFYKSCLISVVNKFKNLPWFIRVHSYREWSFNLNIVELIGNLINNDNYNKLFIQIRIKHSIDD